MPRFRPLLVLPILVAVAVAVVAVVLLPNVAGSAFVEVRAVARPAETSSSRAATVVVGDGPATRAGRLELEAQVSNRYPLPVVVGFRGPAFRAVIYSRPPDGVLERVWEASLDDAVLEEGSESPAGDSGSRAAAIDPGSTTRPVATGQTAFRWRTHSGAALAPGFYFLRVWAYGIPSGLTPIALTDA